MTCPRSRMNRLNDVTVSRISVRLGCQDSGGGAGVRQRVVVVLVVVLGVVLVEGATCKTSY